MKPQTAVSAGQAAQGLRRQEVAGHRRLAAARDLHQLLPVAGVGDGGGVEGA